jgi:hypothetical protein
VADRLRVGRRLPERRYEHFGKPHDILLNKPVFRNGARAVPV